MIPELGHKVRLADRCASQGKSRTYFQSKLVRVVLDKPWAGFEPADRRRPGPEETLNRRDEENIHQTPTHTDTDTQHE